MDCLGFADLADNSLFWKLNSLVLPITDIGKIMIKNWDDDNYMKNFIGFKDVISGLYRSSEKDREMER